MKYKILVADDEPAIVKLITDTMDSLGADVVASTDSQQVAEHLNRQRFDGVFLDIRMPGLNGIELTKQTRASSVNAQIPIVILTGQNDGDTMREAFRAGATLFLGKPFNRDRIRGLYGTMCGPMLLERRHHARVPFQTRVKCTWGSVGEWVIYTNSRSISEDGMSLVPIGGVEVGQELNLEFALRATNGLVKTQAKVVAVPSLDYIGVEFTDPSSAAQEAIRNLIVGSVDP